nr:MAG TPA: hypothetical protein [Caudoviricetes sp.]
MQQSPKRSRARGGLCLFSPLLLQGANFVIYEKDIEHKH